MLKIGRSWNMPAAAAAVLLAGLTVQAAEAGQLLRLRFGNGALATGTFLVLEREEPDSVMVCRLLSGNGQFRIHSSWLEQLPFGEKASVFAVSEYLFFACFEDKKSAGAYAELGEALGGSKRIALYRNFVNRCDALFNDLAFQFNQRGDLIRLRVRVLNQGAYLATARQLDASTLSAGEAADRISECESKIVDTVAMWDGNSLISEALEAGDVFAATALFELFAQRLRRLMDERLTPRDELDLRLRTLLRENEAGLAAGAAKVRRMSDPRAERFGWLFPGARGLWNEAVPAGYEQLRQGIRRSYRSFLLTDRLSEWTQFEAWGGAMLEVLCMVRDHDTAREFEGRFDAALRKYQTVVMRKPPAESGSGSGAQPKDVKP